MIIGMNIITLGDFALLHGNNHTEFSFTIPPQKHQEYSFFDRKKD